MIPETYNQVIAQLNLSKSGLWLLNSSQITFVSYAELGRLIFGNAEHFLNLGIRYRDFILISLNTDIEHIVTFFSLIAIGAIPVSIKPNRSDSNSHTKYIENLSKNFNIKYGYHTLTSPNNINSIKWCSSAISNKNSIVTEVIPDDLVFIQFSSGSTSFPKAIPITHTNLITNLFSILSVDKRTVDSVMFNFLPLNHDMGLVGGLLSNLIYQNSILLTKPTEFLRRPVESLTVAYRYHVDIIPMPDFAIRYLSKYLSFVKNKQIPHNLMTQINTIYCGSEPIKLKTITLFLQFSDLLDLSPKSLFFCYGLAEAVLLVTGRRFDTIQNSFNSSLPNGTTARVGTPIGDMKINIAYDDIAPTVINKNLNGSIGLIQLQGSSLFKGYWGEATLSETDWFNTGDLGFLHNDNLYVCGRNKDIVIVNGENIFAVDIENYLENLPKIMNSLVMVEEDNIHILLVPFGSKYLDAKKISSLIFQHFGISPKSVIQGKRNDIQRTTSGKAMRQETLKTLQHKGLITKGE